MEILKITTLIEKNFSIIMIFSIIAIVMMIIIYKILMKTLKRKRIKYAVKLGKIEHFAGRLLGFLLFATIIVDYFKLGVTLYLLVFDFLVWCLYLSSHTFEKKLYPRNFRF